MRFRGMDYFQVLIDHHIKKHGGTAHQARIFIRLDGTVSKDEVESVVQTDPSLSWISNLRLGFTGLHAYARIVSNPEYCEFPISVIKLQPEQQWELSTDLDHVNMMSGSPVKIQLFHFPDDCTGILFTFNHILFDYHGIEQFINGFSKGLDLPLIGEYSKTKGVRSRTKEFFHAIWYAFRKGGQSIFSIRKNRTGLEPAQIEFHTTSLSPDELMTFQTCLSNKGLELQESIYLLAVSAMTIYHQLGTSESRRRKMLFQLPVSTRTRKNGKSILFNALSFFYFNLDPNLMNDLDQIITRLSGQMKEQIKAGLPRAFLTFSDIYKVVPFKIYTWMLGLPTKGQLGSFNISILGHTFKGMDQFMGRSICDVLNLPSNTVQPGLTVVYYYYRGEFRITTSWVEGEFDLQEKTDFHRALRTGLLGMGAVPKSLE